MAKQPQRRPAPAPKKTSAAPVRRNETRKENLFSAGSRELIFDKSSLMIMGGGLLLVLLGLLTMSGGAMTDPNEWKPEEIYSFRRITLAPMIMVAGFLLVVYGIFKKSGKPAETDESTNSEEA